jgi:cytochrome b
MYKYSGYHLGEEIPMKGNYQILVWDRFIRFCHWSLVLLFFLAYVTADDQGPLHRYAGYTILGLVVIRILWGFVGSKHALFSDFMCSPAKALTYIKEIATGKPQYYTGHNPAAAWMIVFFLTCSIVVCLSGFMAFTTKEMKHSLWLNNKFSFVESVYANEKEEHGGKHNRHQKHKNGEKKDSKSDSFWGEIHEVSAQCMLLLIFFHIVGVAVSSKAHHENLVKSMITGKKGIHDS